MFDVPKLPGIQISPLPSSPNKYNFDLSRVVLSVMVAGISNILCIVSMFSRTLHCCLGSDH